jgi:hypothetical protein
MFIILDSLIVHARACYILRVRIISENLQGASDRCHAAAPSTGRYPVTTLNNTCERHTQTVVSTGSDCRTRCTSGFYRVHAATYVVAILSIVTHVEFAVQNVGT